MKISKQLKLKYEKKNDTEICKYAVLKFNCFSRAFVANGKWQMLKCKEILSLPFMWKSLSLVQFFFKFLILITETQNSYETTKKIEATRYSFLAKLN